MVDKGPERGCPANLGAATGPASAQEATPGRTAHRATHQNRDGGWGYGTGWDEIAARWVEVLGRYSNIPNLPQLPQQYNTSHTVPIATSYVHAVRRRLSAEAIQQLVSDYQAGVPSTQLATRYGISKGAVLRLLREQGIPIRRQAMTEADIDQAAQLYRAGNSLAAVGAKLGYDHGTVWQALKRAEVAMRDTHGRAR